MKKIKIYFQHGGTDEKFMKRSIEVAGAKRNVETLVLIDEDFWLLEATKIDMYILHNSEISTETIKIIRKKNPQSLVYCLFGGGYKMAKEEEELFDRVYDLGSISLNNWEEIFHLIKQSMVKT